MRPDQWLDKLRPEFFTQELEEEFAAYAMEQYPNEACAYVLDGLLVPVVNVSTNSKEEFELGFEDALIMSEADGFLHSHPDGNLWPSGADMQAQIHWQKPFGIVTCTEDSCSKSLWWGDHTLSLPLNERPFIHGVLDCYALIRAEKYQRDGIILPDYARDFEWWERDRGENVQNLYEENFRNAGYEVVTDGLKQGDIIFMKIHTDVVSHAAIYTENGLILHHLRDRFSREEHASSWKKFNEKVVRYKD